MKKKNLTLSSFEKVEMAEFCNFNANATQKTQLAFFPWYCVIS